MKEINNLHNIKKISYDVTVQEKYYASKINNMLYSKFQFLIGRLHHILIILPNLYLNIILNLSIELNPTNEYTYYQFCSLLSLF